jgi:hypothetical protein
MGSMTDVFEKKLLDYLFRDASLGLDATNMWIALFTTTPTDSTTGTEVSGGSYARVAVVRTGAGWDAASGASPGTTQNTGAITFADRYGGLGDGDGLRDLQVAGGGVVDGSDLLGGAEREQDGEQR